MEIYMKLVCTKCPNLHLGSK